MGSKKQSSGILFSWGLVFVILFCSGFSIHALAQQKVASEILKQLPFRYIGPEGNRFSSVVGVPGDSNVAYTGSASGGIFKTIVMPRPNSIKIRITHKFFND